MDEEIQEQFLVLGVTLDQPCLLVCTEICKNKDISPEELAEMWLAYSLSHPTRQAAQPTPDLIMQMINKQTDSDHTTTNRDQPNLHQDQ